MDFILHIITMNKKTLRNQIRILKKQYSEKTLILQSEKICQQLEQHPIFQAANTILLYHSLPDEVDTHKLIRKYFSQKNILLPVVCGDTLEIRRYMGDDHLIPEEKYGIYEPQGKAYTDTEQIELAIIPGMAFDLNGHRLGRGKGYYDKLLSTLKGPTYKIGLCFKFQLLPHIPCEQHDIIMDEIVSYPEE